MGRVERGTVVLDFDGVIADLSREWIKRLNVRYGTDYRPGDITRWDMASFFPEEEPGGVYGILHESNLYDYVEPMYGALEGVKELRDMGFRVKVASSCVGSTMVEGKLRWMRRYGLFPEPYRHWPEDFIATPDKSVIRGKFLVDDKPKNLHGFVGNRILFDAPYNKDAHYRRVRRWDELVSTIEVLNSPPVYIPTVLAPR